MSERRGKSEVEAIPAPVKQWLSSELECFEYWARCKKEGLNVSKEDVPKVAKWIRETLKGGGSDE